MEGETGSRKRISRGRQKIPMQKIADEKSLYASFSKRRDGVFKKANELSLECKVNVGIIISSPTDKLHSFMAPTPGTVASYSKIHINQDEDARCLDASRKSQIEPLCRHLEQLDARKRVAIERKLQLMARTDMVIQPDSSWEKPEKDLGYEEAKSMESSLASVLFLMKRRAIQLNNLQREKERNTK